MMQQLPGRRALALVAALALAGAGTAYAQDTTETGGARFDTTAAGAGAMDTTGADTSAQMDRDTSAANDTSAVRDSTDSSGVENPPGYRGMERDTTMFPPDSGQSQAPDQGASQTTDTSEDSAADTTEGNGYRSERPAAADSAAHDSMDHTGAADTTGQASDSTP
jgi:hypothetical protein